MKHVLLITIFLSSYSLLSQPDYFLGARLDGFEFSTADRTDTYGGNTYELWVKEATNTNNDFLFYANSFANKWQNQNTPFDAFYTLFSGDAASPDALFTNNPTIGNNYIFKLKRNQSDDLGNFDAIVMEMENEPVDITGVTQSPAGNMINSNQDVTVTAMLSAMPSSEEKLYLRYSTDNFATYGTLVAGDDDTAATQTFTIPGQPNGTPLDYYLFTSTLSIADLNGDQNLTDLATIDFSNNGGGNFMATFPVEFSDIKAIPERKGIDLTFATATETNNQHFHIERSGDSRRWEAIGRLVGAGTTQEAQRYNFLDAAPLAGRNYYRVRQVDYDGTFSHSRIVSATWNGQPEVHLFPNPVTDVLQITGLSATEQDLQLEIVDVTGRRVLQQLGNGNTVDVSSLSEGIYWLRISDARGLVSQLRFLK